jgi:HlyD family secretion protein
MKNIIYLFLALTSFTFISCGSGNDKDTIEASGNIESINVVVSSQVSGRIISILKDEGEQVNAEDTVMIIDPLMYELKLREAESALTAVEAQYQLLKTGARKEDINQAEENLKQAEINFQSAEKDKERFENLYKSKSVTKKQYDDVIARYEISQAQFNAAKENYNKIKNLARPEELKQAEANVNRLKANVDLIKKSLNDCYVTAPSNGIIVNKFVETGENVGMMSSLFKVSKLSAVDLMLYVSTTELGKVKLGQSVEIKVDTYPDKTYKGKVVYISPEAEFTPKNIQTKEERTKLVFAVKVRIDNPDFELKTGMPADATIITKLQD